MNLMVSTLDMIDTTTGAGLQSYVLEDQRFFSLIHSFSQEAT